MRNIIPTIDQLVNDPITQVAAKYWSPNSEKTLPFDEKIVNSLYVKELKASNFSVRRTMLLEFTQYLECFLWPNYCSDKASTSHAVSIAALVNEKFRERVPVWELFTSRPEQFPGLFHQTTRTLLENEKLSIREQRVLLMFLDHCFNSVEVEVVRKEIQKYVSLPIWCSLTDGRRDTLLQSNAKMRKFWNALKKADSKKTPAELEQANFERTFLYKLLLKFIRVVEGINVEKPNRDEVKYCERFLEFLVDIESLLPTRRFFNALLANSQVLTRARLSPLPTSPHGHLFSQLLDMLEFYLRFEIDDLTGEPCSKSEMIEKHYGSITALQLAAFKQFKDKLGDFYLANVAGVDTRKALQQHFSKLQKDDLYAICEMLHLVPSRKVDDTFIDSVSNVFLLEILLTDEWNSFLEHQAAM